MSKATHDGRATARADQPRRALRVGIRTAMALIVAAASATWGAGAALAEDGADRTSDATDRTPRVVELRSREVDLTFRSTALDGSEWVEEDADTKTIALAADVLFAFDEAELTPDAARRIDDLADELAELGPRAVAIEGHTDAKGSAAYNQDLSVRRARAVESHLASQLGSGFSYEVSGLGDSQPVAANKHPDGSDDPEGRALNRRVVVTFATG